MFSNPTAITFVGYLIVMVGVGLFAYRYTRNYSDYMYYGPIPHSEILKWSNLKQNKGW